MICSKHWRIQRKCVPCTLVLGPQLNVEDFVPQTVLATSIYLSYRMAIHTKTPFNAERPRMHLFEIPPIKNIRSLLLAFLLSYASFLSVRWAIHHDSIFITADLASLCLRSCG